MITNFDLIWFHVKKLMDDLTATRQSLLDEELFRSYCEAFEQLMQVVEAEKDSISQDKLEELKFYLVNLERQYARAQDELKSEMAQERVKAMAHSAYSISGKLLTNFNKQS